MRFKVTSGKYGGYKVNGGTIKGKYYKVATASTKTRAQSIADARNRLVKKKEM